MITTIPVLSNQNPTISIIRPAEEKPQPKPDYIIKENDVLERVAADQGVTVQRLYDKNLNINNPDVIQVGEVLQIPREDEKLETRKLPVQNTPTSPQNSLQSHPVTAGNSYYWGQCVWHVKNLRPEIPNTWGNGSDWFGNAQRDGWATGAEPRVGAVAAAKYYNHVSLVLEVSGDQIYVTEMNVHGVGVESKAWYPASDYMYIY